MHRPSIATHVLLYALLLITPITAMLGAWWGGHPVTLLAVGDIASPLAPIHARGEALAEIHGWLGNAILWWPAYMPQLLCSIIMSGVTACCRACCPSESPARVTT
jgi:hypothetical protein